MRLKIPTKSGEWKVATGCHESLIGYGKAEQVSEEGRGGRQEGWPEVARTEMAAFDWRVNNAD